MFAFDCIPISGENDYDRLTAFLIILFRLLGKKDNLNAYVLNLDNIFFVYAIKVFVDKL